MSQGLAHGPNGFGTDNMSCIIIQFKKGAADDAVRHLEPELDINYLSVKINEIDIQKDEYQPNKQPKIEEEEKNEEDEDEEEEKVQK